MVVCGAGDSIISAAQFNKANISAVLDVGAEMERLCKTTGSTDLLDKKVMVNLFFEPSTRTISSFHAAMSKLGGKVLRTAFPLAFFIHKWW